MFVLLPLTHLISFLVSLDSCIPYEPVKRIHFVMFSPGKSFDMTFHFPHFSVVTLIYPTELTFFTCHSLPPPNATLQRNFSFQPWCHPHSVQCSTSSYFSNLIIKSYLVIAVGFRAQHSVQTMVETH